MCGIVGVISWDGSALAKSHVAVLSDLLYVGALRGTDGTGVFTGNKHGARQSLKIGGPPEQLFGCKDWMNFVRFVDHRNTPFIVGHNRWATVGKPTTENAHPFRHGKTTMVHNGTIRGWGKYNEEALKFPVDSEAVCFLIDKYGLEEVMKEITGAWALVYWNEEDKKLRVFRNHERPLHFVEAPNQRLWYFASEARMLQWVLGRGSAQIGEIKAIETNTLLTFNFKDRDPEQKKIDSNWDKIQAEAGEAWAAWIETQNGTQYAARKDTSLVADEHDVLPPAPPKSNYPAPALVTPPSKRKPAILNPNFKPSWVSTGALKDLVVGKEITLEFVDYDPVADTHQQGFVMQLMHDQYPDVQFRCNVTGADTMDELLTATRIKAKIKTILKSNNSTVHSAHRVFLEEPVGETDEDPNSMLGVGSIVLPDDEDIPEHAYAGGASK